MVSKNERRTSISSPYGRPASATLGSAGDTFRMMGRRRITKFRFRVMLLVYIALGCIIPYYVMKHADDELLSQQGHDSELEYQSQPQQIQLLGSNINGAQDSIGSTINTEPLYRRRAFFEELTGISEQDPQMQAPYLLQPRHRLHQEQQQQSMSRPLRTNDNAEAPALTPLIQKYKAHLLQQHRQLIQDFGESYQLLRKQNKMLRLKNAAQYQFHVENATRQASEFVHKILPPEYLFSQTRIPGTRLDTSEKTNEFRLRMDQAMNQGRWVYEPNRDYPDFGGAIAWSKKKQNERDRDVTIDRAPFPEAGKYRWEPIPVGSNNENNRSASISPPSLDWYSTQLQPEDFCRLLGTRHILLVGDLIHWQLHDSIMYSMFDTPQICYGDMACHLGVGHPLCPNPPNDVRLKFVRNDVLSPVRAKLAKSNETRSHFPVEMPWLKDLKLKDTVILGAPHQAMTDKVFRKKLAQTMLKIRLARPETLVIYRNNPLGHPDCPSKFNGFNTQQPLGTKADPVTTNHKNTTSGPPAKPFEHDIPIATLLGLPMNWSHYDRQNQIAKVIVEAAGGIYWNIATMTNRRPDGHVGGHDCLGYKRPGPTDEWAVSLYNLFKNIESVELNMTLSKN
ncbi:hypothetical protein BG004_003235 [Podila humilis]|nr:hypothetical protein BG004_003235 [Podila humilis]